MPTIHFVRASAAPLEPCPGGHSEAVQACSPDHGASPRASPRQCFWRERVRHIPCNTPPRAAFFHCEESMPRARQTRITPCRDRISDRFPVASFVVHVPHDRFFEIACATDPRLFHPDRRHQRTARNFLSSRYGGLLRAPAGEATYLVPPHQLKQFAGSTRLYYALGTYGGVRGEDPTSRSRPTTRIRFRAFKSLRTLPAVRSIARGSGDASRRMPSTARRPRRSRGAATPQLARGRMARPPPSREAAAPTTTSTTTGSTSRCGRAPLHAPADQRDTARPLLPNRPPAPAEASRAAGRTQTAG